MHASAERASVGWDGPDRLKLTGEIDLGNVEALRAALDACPDGPTDIVVDLTDLGYIDSSGIGAMLRAHEQLQAQGRRLVLEGASGPVLRVIQILELEANGLAMRSG
jgi:anti-sigma B factor antagonist